VFPSSEYYILYSLIRTYPRIPRISPLLSSRRYTYKSSRGPYNHYI